MQPPNPRYAWPPPPPPLPAPYAEFLPRFLARLIDTLILSPTIIGFVAIPVWVLFRIPKSGPMPDAERVIIPAAIAFVVWMLLAFVARWLYHAVLESSDKQGTIGKQRMGIRVTDLRGNRITFGRASARWMMDAFLTSQTMFIGYLTVEFTERKQTIHDMMAETLVLQYPKPDAQGQGPPFAG